MEKEKVNGYLHHQVVWDCPECHAMNVEDLGELPSFDCMEVECSECGNEFELTEDY